MNMSDPGLRWDPVARRHYRLTPGTGGTGVRTYVDPNGSASGFPPPRTSSRDNPLALPQQQPSVPQVRPAAVNPTFPQAGNPQQVSRTPVPAGGRGASGNTNHPQPVEPYGASRLPSRYSQSAPQSGTARSLTAEVDRLSISNTRPNAAQQGSRPQPQAARTSGYQAAGGSPYLDQGYVSGHQGQAPYILPSQYQYPRQTFGPAQPYVNPYVNASVEPPQSNHPWSQVPSSQPSYTSQIPQSPYGPSPGSNTAQGARSNQNYQSPYLQPATRPSDVTPTVAPGVPTSGSPPAGEYRNDRSHYEDETVEDNITAELVRGTKGPYELLDPNFKVIRDHWRFFVVGRVFKYLSWEPQGNGNPNERSGNSVQKYQTRSSKLGQEAFAKVYRYVVVRARPKQGYSMCLRITTHNGHGTVGKLIMQREHSIIYTGEEAPARLPEEKKLNKDPIQVIPVENAEPLDPLSRINYAKPYPIEHNVKVCEVGMVAPRDVRKINAYYQQESGYETERPQQEPERRRRESSSAVSKEPERRRRESSSSMNKEPERKVRREQRRDSRR